MAGITASMLMAGPQLSQGGGFTAQTNKRQSDDSWRTDVAVGKNADTIFAWLKDRDRQNAKTLQEIQQQFPALSQPQIETALKRLIYECRASRIGLGTADAPYRYFGYCGATD